MTAAAAAPLRPLIAGPARSLTVAAVFPAAVYLADPATGRVVLSVVTADGIAQPNAIRLRASAGSRPFIGIRDREHIEVGDNCVVLPTGSVPVTRWWSPRPALGRFAPRQLAATVDRVQVVVAARTEPLPGDLAQRLSALTVAVASGRQRAAVDAVDRLLGLGTGLTPTGDDLVAGCLAAATTLAPVVLTGAGLSAPSVDALGAVADRIGTRADVATTAISAALLRHAVVGEVCAPAAKFLRCLAGSPSSVRPADVEALTGLLEVGGTSGRDLALGLLAGARMVATASEHPSPTPALPTSLRSS